MPEKKQKIMLNKKNVENYIRSAKDFYINDKENVDELVELSLKFPEHNISDIIVALVNMKKPKTTIFKVLTTVGYEVR